MPESANGNIVVLNPTAAPRDLRHDMASRQSDIRGLTVGFLWNNKPNGDILFNRIEELLRQKYEINATMHRSKATASIPAPKEVLDELATSAQAVVVGLAD